jgi:hypothetical protein
MKTESLSMSWRHIRGAEALLHSFLTSSIDKEKWSTSRPDHLTSGRKTDTPWIECWMESWRVYAIRRIVKSLPPASSRTKNRPARSLVAIPTTLSPEYSSEYMNSKAALEPNSYIHMGLIFSAILVGSVLFLTREL